MRNICWCCDNCGRRTYSDENRYYVTICGHEFRMCDLCVDFIPGDKKQDEQKEQDET